MISGGIRHLINLPVCTNKLPWGIKGSSRLVSNMKQPADRIARKLLLFRKKAREHDMVRIYSR